jgi:hypothetical protein
VQVRTSPGQLSRWIDLHPFRRADNAYQLAFRQYRATAYASPLRDVFYAFRSFLSHLNLPSPFLYKQGQGIGVRAIKLPIFFKVIAAALVLLARNDLTKIFIVLNFDVFLLFLLTLLFTIAGFFFLFVFANTSCLEHFF